MDSVNDMQTKFWSPLCKLWSERIEAAKKRKEAFQTVYEQCMSFYNGEAGFMWKSEHNRRFFGGRLPSPKFRITLNKAYEFVSIYGPSLFWQYPHCKVMSQRSFELTPDMFGDPNDEQVQQIFAQFKSQDDQERMQGEFANRLMESVLNWSQRENRVVDNGQLAIVESLLSGLGTLWVETYRNNGTQETFTKLSYHSVKNLFVDAGCTDPDWNTAGYIMLRHCMPTWEVEQIFDLKPGSLRGKGTKKSAEQASREQSRNAGDTTTATNDLLEWYEIWSRVGVGPKRRDDNLMDQFEELVGDFAYLCIAPGVNYPLNAHPSNFFGENAWTDEDTLDAFEWRCANFGDALPAWMDNRWPVAPLRYNKIPGTPWPMAPMAPGLGYLIALNVLTSSYVDQAWENRKTIIAYAKSAEEDLKDALMTDKAFIDVGIHDNYQKGINDLIQIMKRPESNRDLLQAISMMAAEFDKNVGLNELLYGQEGGRQVRVAADIRERSANASVRPDKMAGDVASWMTEASQLQMFATAMHVRGESLAHLLGSFGAQWWDQYFGQLPIPQMMKEMKATVEASEVRRPNKERDTANVQSLQQFWLPFLAQYGQQSGNYEPVNGFLESIGKAMEMDTSEFQIPGPTPEQHQMQQMQQAIDQMAAKADIEKTGADTQKAMAQAQKAVVDAQVAMLRAGANGEPEHVQKLRHAEESHNQSLIHNQEEHVQKLLFDESEMMLEEARAEREGGDDGDAE